jgi:hypothetical protein
VRAYVYPGAWACTCACVRVVLLIQHETPVRHIVTSFVAPLALPNFTTLSHKRHDFRKKKVTEHKICVLIFDTTFVCHIFQSKKKLVRYCHKCESVFM